MFHSGAGDPKNATGESQNAGRSRPQAGYCVLAGVTRITPTPFSMAIAVPNGLESVCTFSRMRREISGVGVVGFPAFDVVRRTMPMSTGWRRASTSFPPSKRAVANSASSSRALSPRHASSAAEQHRPSRRLVLSRARRPRVQPRRSSPGTSSASSSFSAWRNSFARSDYMANRALLPRRRRCYRRRPPQA